MDPPCKEEWIGIVEEIYVMEKLSLRLQAQLEEKLGGMDTVQNQNRRRGI